MCLIVHFCIISTLKRILILSLCVCFRALPLAWWWSSQTQIRNGLFDVCSRWLVRWASSIRWPCSLERTVPMHRQVLVLSLSLSLSIALWFSYYTLFPPKTAASLCYSVKKNVLTLKSWWYTQLFVLCYRSMFLYLFTVVCVCVWLGVFPQVQQQAALMASVGQGGYLSPMAAFAAAQMQHMATINGLPGAPMTPTSGEIINTHKCTYTWHSVSFNIWE